LNVAFPEEKNWSRGLLPRVGEHIQLVERTHCRTYITVDRGNTPRRFRGTVWINGFAGAGMPRPLREKGLRSQSGTLLGNRCYQNVKDNRDGWILNPRQPHKTRKHKKFHAFGNVSGVCWRLQSPCNVKPMRKRSSRMERKK